MVGNDVVDLRDPESAAETLHPRFDKRVFSVREREAMAESRDAARLRWKFWAAKESASGKQPQLTQAHQTNRGARR